LNDFFASQEFRKDSDIFSKFPKNEKKRLAEKYNLLPIFLSF